MAGIIWGLSDELTGDFLTDYSTYRWNLVVHLYNLCFSLDIPWWTYVSQHNQRR